MYNFFADILLPATVLFALICLALLLVIIIQNTKKMKECLEWYWFFMEAERLFYGIVSLSFRPSAVDELVETSTHAQEKFEQLAEEIRQCWEKD